MMVSGGVRRLACAVCSDAANAIVRTADIPIAFFIIVNPSAIAFLHSMSLMPSLPWLTLPPGLLHKLRHDLLVSTGLWPRSRLRHISTEAIGINIVDCPVGSSLVRNRYTAWDTKGTSSKTQIL